MKIEENFIDFDAVLCYNDGKRDACGLFPRAFRGTKLCNISKGIG